MQTQAKQTRTTATTKEATNQEQHVQAKLAQYGVEAKLMVFTF